MKKLLTFVWVALALFMLIAFSPSSLANAVVASDTFEVFTDVQEEQEDMQMSYYLKNQQILHGYPDGSLQLDKQINRAEFTKIILESKDDVDIYYDENYSFPDVDQDAWFAKYVSSAKRLGIIQGYPDGTFRPANEINYAESITIIAKTFDLEDGSFERNLHHLENTEAFWYGEFLKKIASRNLLDFNWNFDAGEAISRKYAFQILYRALIDMKFDDSYFNLPRISFAADDGFIFMHPKEDFRIPVLYQNVGSSVNMKIYKAGVNEFLEGINEINNKRWNELKLASSELISKMELLEEKEVSISKFEEVDDEDSLLKGYVDVNFENPGLYFFVLENEYLLPSHHFMNVSRNMILTKSTENQNLVYLTDYETEETKTSASVSFYDVNDADEINLVRKNQIDGNGVYLDSAIEARYVVAQDGEDISVLKTWLDNSESREEYRGFLFTDRSLYKPGDTVYFKAILRELENGKYNLLSGQKVKVEVFVKKNGVRTNNVIFEKEMDLNEYSSVYDSFEIHEEDPTGYYYMLVYLGDRSVVQRDFQVEAYKKNEFRLMVETDKKEYSRGDIINANVKGEYFFGAPLKDQKVSYEITRQPLYYWGHQETRSEKEAEIFGLDEDHLVGPSYWSQVVESGESTLNQNGELNISYRIDDFGKNIFNGRKYIYKIKVTAIDASNISVSGINNVSVYPSEIEFELDNTENYPLVNEEHNWAIKVRDRNGHPYEGADLMVKVLKKEKGKEDDIYYDHFLDEKILPYNYGSYKELFSFGTVKSDANGYSPLGFLFAEAGQYRFEIEVKDKRGNSSRMHYDFSLYAEDEEIDYYFLDKNSVFSMELDKDVYEVGDVAQVSLHKKADVKNLLWTTYRNTFDKIEVKSIEGENGWFTYQIPITEDMVGGFGISADVYHKFKFFGENLRVKVLPSNKKLDVDIEANDETFLPGETVDYIVSLKDENASPVTGDVTFMLVDKAIFDLLSKTEQDSILRAFYDYQSYYSLNTYSSHLSRGQAPRLYDDWEIEEEDMDGEMMMDESVAEFEAPQAMKKESSNASEVSGEEERKTFADTAYYLASVITNELGEASIKVKLPDNLTTWKAFAIAQTKDTKVGDSEDEILVQKEFMVSPFVPRFVTEGDTVVIRANFRNINSDISDYTASLSGSGFSAAELTQNVSILKGNSKEISWNVLVSDSTAMTVKFVMQAVDSSKNDTITLQIPVKSFGEENTYSFVGENNAEISLSVDAVSAKNIDSVKIILSPTLAEKLVDSLQYLVGFPYGCVEQTMSKFLPNVIVYQHKDALGLSGEKFADLNEQIEAGVSRLYNYQHIDGGWGWWEFDETHPKNTAYVIYGLYKAKEAGFEINEKVLDDAMSRLGTYIKNDDSLNDSMKIYLSYVYSLVKKEYFHEEYSVANLAVKTELKGIDYAYLALSAYEAGDQVQAQSMIDKLKTKIQQSGSWNFVKEKVVDYEYMQSDYLSTAMALEALATLRPNDSVVSGLIRYIDEHTVGGIYHETHATAHSVIALVKYLTVKGIGSSDGVSYEVKLNDVLVEGGSLTEKKTISIDPTTLVGNDVLKINKSSGSVLYYSVIKKETVEVDAVQAKNNGMSVSRKYYDLSGRELIGEVDAGTTVKVELKVKSDADSRYVMIKDNLPAGFEPVNSRLKEGDVYHESNWWGSRVSSRDIRDDHVALFVHRLDGGIEKIYNYYAIAVNPGTYRVNSANVEMMYMPEINGRSSSSVMVVK